MTQRAAPDPRWDCTTKITNATARGTYTGRELAPYDGRPGAMDAYKLPSRVGRQLLTPRAVRKGQP